MVIDDKEAAKPGLAAFVPSQTASPRLPWGLWAILAVLFMALVGSFAFGATEAGTFALLILLAFPIALMAKNAASPLDSQWIPNWIMAGWAAKLAASIGRYWALEVLYNGVGDATGYHNFGTRYADMWRALEVPPFGTGTEFIQWATGVLYIPYTPTKLGGFVLFATIAFVGQILLYLAFRRARPHARLKWYAGLIFFFPNIVYWPSSIGKESLMIFFIGIAAYGAVRMFAEYQAMWMAVVAIGLVGTGVIRSHIALLIIGSLTVAVVFGRGPENAPARMRRLISAVVAVILLVGVGAWAIQDFGIDLSSGVSDELLTEELDPIFAGVEEQTDKGGSAVEGSAIRSPLDVPEAVLRVVFQPLPWDAHNTQALVNSFVEGMFLLLLFIWRLPAIARGFFRKARDPYVMFSLVYTAGFIFGHSAVLNLGIMARQRSQLIPFVLVILVAMGMNDSGKDVAELEDTSAKSPLPPKTLVVVESP